MVRFKLITKAVGLNPTKLEVISFIDNLCTLEDGYLFCSEDNYQKILKKVEGFEPTILIIKG